MSNFDTSSALSRRFWGDLQKSLPSIFFSVCDYGHCLLHASKTYSLLITDTFTLLPSGKQDFKIAFIHIENWKHTVLSELQMYLTHMKIFCYIEGIRYFIGVKNCFCFDARTLQWQFLIVPGVPTGMKRKLFISDAVIYNPNTFHSESNQRMRLSQNPNCRQIWRAETELQCRKRATKDFPGMQQHFI